MDGVYEVQRNMQHVCVRGGVHTLNNKTLRKLLSAQRPIQESVLCAGMWQSLAAQ